MSPYTPGQLVIAKTIRDYWLHPDTYTCITGLTLRKPSFPTWVANAQVGSQKGEYSLDWPPGKGDGGKAHGAAQWHDNRRNNIKDYTGIDIYVASCLQQQRAMWFELTGTCAACHHLLNVSQDEQDAVAALVNDFEYSDKRARDITRRTAYALEAKAYFGG